VVVLVLALGAGLMARVTDQVAVWAGDSPSLTVPESTSTPGSAGVPLMMSELPQSPVRAVSPAGRFSAGVNHPGPAQASSSRFLPLNDPDGDRLVFTGH
jgi:hypothetical protein